VVAAVGCGSDSVEEDEEEEEEEGEEGREARRREGTLPKILVAAVEEMLKWAWRRESEEVTEEEACASVRRRRGMAFRQTRAASEPGRRVCQVLRRA